MNILITSVGNKTNLIKYFRRALFNEGGGKIIGTDSQILNNGRHFVDEFLVSPKSEDENYTEWLLALIKEKKIILYVPSRDGELLAAAAVKERAATLGCYVAVSNKETLEHCLDKSIFYQWCEDNNFTTAPLYDKGIASEKDLPLFVKPKQGFASQGTMKIETWSQWLSICDQLNDEYLIQAFIDELEYTIDVCIVNGEVLSVVPRVRVLVSGGESIQARVEMDQGIIDKTTFLAKSLKLDGHVTVQCFKDCDEVVFSEVNARYGGGFTLGIEAGADSCRELVRYAQGKPKHMPVSIADGLEMIRIQKDIFTERSKKQTYCFDLDGTICSESCVYEDAEPMPVVVNYVNTLYAGGHHIIIATARGAASGKDWLPLVRFQLKKWGVKYHEIISGKPYADFYVDNKAVDILELYM